MYPNLLNRVLLFSLFSSTLSLTTPSIPNAEVIHDEPSLEAIARRYTRRTAGGLHLPIIRTEVPPELQRRDQVSAIGLGNFFDVAYSVLLTVGTVTTPLIIDTGSSDLWLMSDACRENCDVQRHAALYPTATFDSAGLGAQLFYGDSTTGTSAFGLVGKDTVSLAGLTLPEQYFAAINQTNTTIADVGSSGIFGLGFPVNSVVWNELFATEVRQAQDGRVTRRDEASTSHHKVMNHGELNLQSRFPSSLPNILGPNPDASHHERRQTSPSLLRRLFDSWSTFGPLVPRIVLDSDLEEPMVTVALQRNTIDVGSGQIGLLSIGELPPGTNSSDYTWAPVRPYPAGEGGLPAPADSPIEQYPIAWEVMIDDVYLDGEKLPRSTLSPSSIELSALIDTGNSLVRGPADVVQEIYTRISGRPARTRVDAGFPCGEPHTLAFSIGGKLFPVDPRDFATQLFVDDVTTCASTIVSTDSPDRGGYLFSWNIGVPFLKSVIASYYYGNITYPSQDPPRIGFLSTVPEDAGDRLKAAVASADRLDGNFPAISAVAPSGTFNVQSGGSKTSEGGPRSTRSPGSASGRIHTRSVFSFMASSLALAMAAAWL